VREIESSDYVCFNLSATHREIIDKLRTERVTESYILDNNNKFLGKLNLLDVVDSTQSIEELMDKQPLCLHPDNSITEALEIASQFVGESIPIIEDGHLLGALTEGDLFSQVLTLQEKLRAE
jgi:CIC family chloride channel protein